MTKIFWVDGACSGNPGPGGFGVVQLDEVQARRRNEWGHWSTDYYATILAYKYSEYCNNTTNNREELKAILHVFKLAAADKDYKYIIYSDSAYAVNMINSWIFGWAKNGWKNSKKQEVENIDLVKELYNYLNIDFFNCQVKKCDGHSGELGNEIADALATNNNTKFKKLIQDNRICLPVCVEDYENYCPICVEDYC